MSSGRPHRQPGFNQAEGRGRACVRLDACGLEPWQDEGRKPGGSGGPQDSQPLRGAQLRK